MTDDLKIVVGVCWEDNPRDVDETYGAGTYVRLFPQTFYEADANRLYPKGCQCTETNGGGDCPWCRVYYDGPTEEQD